VGPIVKAVWRDIDGVVQAIGSWETVLKSILGFVVLKWSVDSHLVKYDKGDWQFHGSAQKRPGFTGQN